MTSPGLRWEVTAAPTAELGERPVWEASSGRLIWVDINAGQLHELDPDGSDRVIASAGVPVGAAAPRTAGGYVLAAADGFRLIGADGLAGPTVRPAGMPLNVRFNDGACDPAGRFWAGTVTHDLRLGAGALYRLGPDGTITTMLDGVTESNGIGWSTDGSTMYFVDSGEPETRIRAFGFDVASGDLGTCQDLVRFPAGGAVPDGLVVDAEDCVWVAMWGGGEVRRYAPDGQLLAVLPVPVSQPTCPAFGGPGFDELYLTSAWQGMTTGQRADEPLAGHVLHTRSGARGSAALAFSG